MLFHGALWQGETLVADDVEGFYEVVDSPFGAISWRGQLTRFPPRTIGGGEYTLRPTVGRDATIFVSRIHVSSARGPTPISFRGSGPAPVG